MCHICSFPNLGNLILNYCRNDRNKKVLYAVNIVYFCTTFYETESAVTGNKELDCVVTVIHRLDAVADESLATELVVKAVLVSIDHYLT